MPHNFNLPDALHSLGVAFAHEDNTLAQTMDVLEMLLTEAIAYERSLAYDEGGITHGETLSILVNRIEALSSIRADVVTLHNSMLIGVG